MYKYPDDTYLDESDSTYKKCYERCASCSTAGNSTNHKCTQCKSNYHFSSVTSGKCITEEESNTECNCYLDDKDDTFKECYERCGSCSKSGNSTQNNCDSCKTGFHKVYNQPGMCIKDNEKPDDTYILIKNVMIFVHNVLLKVLQHHLTVLNV